MTISKSTWTYQINYCWFDMDVREDVFKRSKMEVSCINPKNEHSFIAFFKSPPSHIIVFIIRVKMICT